ncbi:flagellar biosynthesis protein FlhB [Natranaerobius thermophilus]|uniref:Flagellar biosynthetic protein FlhB n=1 Tax=Natranaerobius thermophilus (strain ATCC BAA-1301 / DSM 18059 / JW/NM-WN-LF) TaxID=457570 RepID=B2A365_NATTJ|nr:flagellar biosynthesis protein FlhB [Natranaerobius thermophilus]ACB84995.1 flagellar biosynthetic protein FlhB [Natranaerobius thermophilus JW/NM-WN-LF]
MNIDKRFDLQLFNQEKTETPTPKHRRESRKKGQVAKSTELTSALLLMATFSTLYIVFPYSFDRFMNFAKQFWSNINTINYTMDEIHSLLITMMMEGAVFAAPVIIVAVLIGLISNLMQVGILLTGDPLKPKLERLDPIKGFQKIFSKRAVVELTKSLFKMVVIGIIAYILFNNHMEHFPYFYDMTVMQIAVEVGQLTWALIFRVGMALLFLSILDYVYQVWEHEQNLKMTKQQVKDEHKQTEGDPQVRSKMKEKQREISKKRMMSEVPEADVVITNPVHIAVALKYDEGDTAPMVLAKGQGHVARKIKEIAEDHNVVVMENRQLARSLYFSVEIGDFIPEELYQAVAEVLAFVYRLKKSSGME